MEVIFRKAQLHNKNDAKTIVELLNSFSLASPDKKPLDNSIKNTIIQNLIEYNNSIIYFAELNNEPIGIAVCFKGYSTFLNSILLNIHDFYVKDEFQNQGVGSKFLDFIDVEAEKQGFSRITLETSERNERAVKVYTRKGYIGSSHESPYGVMYAMSKDLGH